MNGRVLAWWWTGSTAVLAAGYLLIAAASPLALVRWPALAGAVLVGVGLCLAARNRPLSLVAIVAGALVPAVFLWWSVIVPVVAVLIVVCGAMAIRSALNRGSTRTAVVR